MSNTKTDQKKMEAVVSLCRRRAFIFQSSEIYGGLSSCWDYGPIGVELKRSYYEQAARNLMSVDAGPAQASLFG